MALIRFRCGKSLLHVVFAFSFSGISLFNRNVHLSTGFPQVSQHLAPLGTWKCFGKMPRRSQKETLKSRRHNNFFYEMRSSLNWPVFIEVKATTDAYCLCILSFWTEYYICGCSSSLWMRAHFLICMQFANMYRQQSKAIKNRDLVRCLCISWEQIFFISLAKSKHHRTSDVLKSHKAKQLSTKLFNANNIWHA